MRADRDTAGVLEVLGAAVDKVHTVGNAFMNLGAVNKQ
jgi:hypothetical protein